MQFNSRRGLTWSARMLAQSVGVHVVEDPHATTFSMRRDGTFVTPVLSEDDDDFSDLVNGGAIHEIAHFIESDFAALDACSVVERTFMMIFEDLRIERWAQYRWAGAAQELKAMWRALYRLGKVTRPSAAHEDVLKAVGTWALAHCRALATGLDLCADDAVLGREIVVAKFGTDAAAHVDEVFTRLAGMASSWDALGLTRLLLKRFVDPQHAQEVPVEIEHSPDVQDVPPSAPGQQGPQGDQGDQRQSPAQSSKDASGSSESGQGEQGSESAPGQTGDGGADGEEGECRSRSPSNEPDGQAKIDVPGFVPMDFDGGELAEAALEEIVCKVSGVRGSAQSVELATADSVAISAGETLIAEAMRHSMGVRERIRHLLLAATRESDVIGRRGKVRATKLWRLRTGNANVFKLHVDGVSMSTYVHVLCDASTSMEKADRIRIALQASAALTMSLEGIPGLSTAISAFPNGTLACGRLKKVDETTQQAGDRLAGKRAQGGTPMAAAVQTIRPEVVASTADRKIVFIPTDGSPDNKPEAQVAIRDLERMGVEVVVIGIGVGADGLAQHTLRINSVADLGEVLFGYLERTFAQVVSQAAA